MSAKEAAKALRVGYTLPKLMEVIMTKAELIKALKKKANLATNARLKPLMTPFCPDLRGSEKG